MYRNKRASRVLASRAEQAERRALVFLFVLFSVNSLFYTSSCEEPEWDSSLGDLELKSIMSTVQRIKVKVSLGLHITVHIS